jgi:integrase
MRIKRCKNKKGIECWYIDVTVWVAKPEMNGGRKQKRRNRYIPLSDCPTRAQANNLANQWIQELEIESKGKTNDYSIPTYRQCAEYYLQSHSYHHSIMRVAEDLGDEPADDKFHDKFECWLSDVKDTEKRVWKRVDGEMKLEKIQGSCITASTLKTYSRYAKAVLNFCAKKKVISENPLGTLRVGKSNSRKRPLTEDEEKKIFAVIDKEYPWFRFPVQFSLSNPIRPQDLFTLKQSVHFDKKTNAITYTPQKTIGRTNEPMVATPIITEELIPHLENLPNPAEIDFLCWRPGYKRNGEDPQKKYPITNYRGIWDKICEKADVHNLHMYDLRHCSVSNLRRKGLQDWMIMKAGGWASLETMDGYDVTDHKMFQQLSNAILSITKEKQKEGAVFTDQFFQMLTTMMSMQKNVMGK